MNIIEKIKQELETIERYLRTLLSSQIPFINQVSEYVIFGGGKRIRPLLTVICGKIFSENETEKLYKGSVLFEYLHAATLLHDDVVDGAEFRRGRKAARNLWGNQATILVGDYLYAKALKIASDFKDPDIMEVITQTTLLMSEGEVLQLLNFNKIELSEKEYEEVIYRKTAALISACCEVGAILGGANQAQRKKLKNFGKYLGLAFQVVDDILDYLSEKTGKDLGKDFKEGKVTLPVVYAMQNAPLEEKEKLKQLFKISEFRETLFIEAKTLIEKNQGFLKAKNKAKEYVDTALSFLTDLPENLYKHMLLYLADYIIQRNI